MPPQSPTYTWPPTTAGVAEISPDAANFHFMASRETVSAVIGSEVCPARVLQTFPPNIGQSPASPDAQSSGVGVAGVAEGMTVGVVPEELWHPGSASVVEPTAATTRRSPLAGRRRRFLGTRDPRFAADRFMSPPDQLSGFWCDFPKVLTYIYNRTLFS